jgi:hypothetical protein
LSRSPIRALAASVLVAGVALPVAGAAPAHAAPECTKRSVSFQTAGKTITEWDTGTDADVQIWASGLGWYPVSSERKHFEAWLRDDFTLCGDFVLSGDVVRLQLRPFQNAVFGTTHNDRWKVASVWVDGREFGCDAWLRPGGDPVDCKAR